MAHLAYHRTSSDSQSIESQRQALLASFGGGAFDEEFSDLGVSGATQAAQRPGFARLLAYARKGDTLHVYAVDRLGRDAIDVQTTIRALIDRGVTVDVRGLGPISRGVGELILAVLAQVADMERGRIAERTAAGREVARNRLAQTGQTQHGKTSLGRPAGRAASGQVDPEAIAAWRLANGASIAKTAAHFKVSPASVKRYSAASAPK